MKNAKRVPKHAVAAVAVASLLALSGCGTRDRIATGALPDDYRTRHPIVVGEQEKVLDMPIATGATRLTHGQTEVIAGFVSGYKTSASGTFRIIVPHNARNAAAAGVASREIRKVAMRYGVPSGKIVVENYSAGDVQEGAPIRLSYFTIGASTSQCGQWPEDLTINTFENKNYYNFGCASQNNLAAQIADPNDLLGPRRMTPADATQRGQALQRYREFYLELKEMGQQ